MAELLLSVAAPRGSLPDAYIRPAHERPNFAAVEADADIPVVDLAIPDRARIAAQIGRACESHGFFQAVNHGLSGELVREMLEVAGEFFRLPAEEKIGLYSDDPAKKVRLSTSFNVREERVRNWRDYLRLHCHPLEDFLPLWPSKPPAFREVVSRYCAEVRRLGFLLLGYISLSLGLDEGYIDTALGEQGQHMAINFYPPCPEPELTYGLPSHTDPNTLTILLPDPAVAGLQVLAGGTWIAVDPKPGAFIVNIGDQLQALSNDKYRSVRHRAVVNSEKARVSVATFICPGNSAVIAPALQLTAERSPAIYRSFTYDEYFKTFWTRTLDQDDCLELFRLQ